VRRRENEKERKGEEQREDERLGLTPVTAPDCNRCFIKVAWSLSPFVSIAIGIGMFIDHCYISVPILSVYSTCAIVVMLFIHDFVQRKKAAERARRCQIRIPPPEPADNRLKSWNEVL
jgi:hypothetical protein